MHFNKFVYTYTVQARNFNQLSPARLKRMTANQTLILMEKFRAKAYLRREETYELSLSLNISKKRIQNWFSSRRRGKVAHGLLYESE